MISLIFSTNNIGVVGMNDGTLPYTSSDDLKRFSKITKTGVIIMGSKTWKSLPQKPLPNRTNFILTSQPINNFPEADGIFSSFEKLWLYLDKNTENNISPYIIGGTSILQQVLSQYPHKIKNIELTRFHRDDNFDNAQILNTKWMSKFSLLESHSEILNVTITPQKKTIPMKVFFENYIPYNTNSKALY